MTTARWLTLPSREGIRTPELATLLAQVGNDYARAWDSCEDPKLATELAAAAGLPAELILGAVIKCNRDCWSHWSGGATDARPVQILNSIGQWLSGGAGFEAIWSTWELAEQVRREVDAWHQQQQGAVLANAIQAAVEGIHSLTTTARNLAEPEPGHDQHDPARYAKKNEDAANAGLLHDAANAVRLATQSGAWYHSHTEPTASAEDHDAYAKQILGFVIRQAIPAEDVVQGLRERLR